MTNWQTPKTGVGSDAASESFGLGHSLLISHYSLVIIERCKHSRAGLKNGKWKMENGKWKMENGKWKMENGKWKMENGKWKMTNATPSAHDRAATLGRAWLSARESAASDSGSSVAEREERPAICDLPAAIFQFHFSIFI